MTFGLVGLTASASAYQQSPCVESVGSPQKSGVLASLVHPMPASVLRKRPSKFGEQGPGLLEHVEASDIAASTSLGPFDDAGGPIARVTRPIAKAGFVITWIHVAPLSLDL